MSIFKKIQLADEALSVFETTTLSTLGYLIAKNNIDYIDDMESWYGVFQGEQNFVNLQEMYRHAMHALVERITKDKFLQLQMENAMRLVDITFEGPMELVDLSRYRKIVDAFMSGVKAAK